MRSTTRTRTAVAGLALLPLLALTACGGSSGGTDGDAEAGATAKACGTLPTADPAAKLPADFPTFTDIPLYEPSTQGSTSIVFGLKDEADFVEVRDSQVEKLKAAGYTIDGTDQESVEAEAEFSGPHTGTIKVQPYCDGYVTVRYKINN